ncbi:hypothetical protein [Streptomyces sp. NBC_00989]|uniref:hypothetical protein n=1 Tax=Streptomyces sp. NBC_00989 TaxID=2903705 RepID=UPI00387069AC|nr:hypothetical protein OG714_39690 [Streptomyces sp. NBC_00989]
MKRPGPLLTLLAGLLLGLFMLTLNTTSGTKTASSAQREASPSASPKASTRPSATPTPSPTPSKTPVANANYAGRTDDDTASVAVSVRDGKAVAYFCDGRYKEAWLRGPVDDDGTMKLTAPNGAVLDGKIQQGKKIHGTVKDEGRPYTFTADKAVKPSGLWRATAKVRGAKIDGGWIVLPNGRQTGIVTRDGKATAAPRIDPETGAVTVDGQQLTAQPVTP